MPDQRSAIVIGAGTVGMATSYALARRDWHVTLIDRAPGPGMGASYGNGAQLAYCFTDALASPGLLAGIVPALIKGHGLRLSPKFDPAFAKWMAAFARNCTARRFEENTLAVLGLAQESQEAMDRLLDRHDIDFGRRVAGKMHLYYSGRELESAQRVVELKAASSCEQISMSAAEAEAVEPALSAIAVPFAGAIHTPSEEVGDAHRFCVGMVEVMRSHYGCETRFGVEVTGVFPGVRSSDVHLDSGEVLTGDLTVICTGAAGSALLGPLGMSAPIQPMKGYSFEMSLSGASPSVSLTDTKHKIVFTNLGDRIRVAGFADLGNGDAAVDPCMSERLIAVARGILPDAGVYAEATNHWAGLRPMTPNSFPIISHPRHGLAVNAGHGMLGWTLAMGAGGRLAQLVD